MEPYFLFWEFKKKHLEFWPRLRYNNPNGTTDKDEKDADLFARDTLIPTDSFSSFVKKKDFRESSIASFAQSVEIDSGIVVGRLQKEGYIKYNWLNKLKTKYSISA